jgi:Domain of unknown function (DUF4160)
MYHDESHHLGRLHFHARYGGDEASVDIENVAVFGESSRPERCGLSLNGRSRTKPSCARNWNRAREHQPLEPIDPIR